MASVKEIFRAMENVCGSPWVLLSDMNGSTGLEACFGFELNTAEVDAACFAFRVEGGADEADEAVIFLAMDEDEDFDYSVLSDEAETVGRMDAIRALCALGVDAGQANAALGVLEGLMILPDDEEEAEA